MIEHGRIRRGDSPFFTHAEKINSEACQRGSVTTSPETSRNPSTKARFEFSSDWKLGLRPKPRKQFNLNSSVATCVVLTQRRRDTEKEMFLPCYPSVVTQIGCEVRSVSRSGNEDP